MCVARRDEALALLCNPPTFSRGRATGSDLECGHPLGATELMCDTGTLLPLSPAVTELKLGHWNIISFVSGGVGLSSVCASSNVRQLVVLTLDT